MSFYQVRGEARRGRCKIYLLLSKNFDPKVVNLSKESSQLNRKHGEERRRGGRGGWGHWGAKGTPTGSSISKEPPFSAGEREVSLSPCLQS